MAPTGLEITGQDVVVLRRRGIAMPEQMLGSSDLIGRMDCEGGACRPAEVVQGHVLTEKRLRPPHHAVV